MEPKVMKVWRMIFLFKSVIFRFHVNFHFRGVTFSHKTTSWWLNQPIRPISQIGSFHQVGVKITNI